MSDTSKTDDLLCPSARCETGAVLVGMVRDDGAVGHIPQRLEVDDDFVKNANADGMAETRFRFASACVKGKCTRWTDGQCGVVELAADKLADMQTEDLPKCSIRSDCRWFKQRAAEACRVCSFVITDDEASSKAYAKHHAAMEKA